VISHEQASCATRLRLAGLWPARPLERLQLALLLLATICCPPVLALVLTDRSASPGQPFLTCGAMVALVALWWHCHLGGGFRWHYRLLEAGLIWLGVASQGDGGWFNTLVVGAVAYRASQGAVRDAVWLIALWTFSYGGGMLSGSIMPDADAPSYVVSALVTLTLLSAPWRAVVAVLERYQAAVDRERALLSAGTALVAAGSQDEVGAVAVRAAESLLEGTGAVVRWLPGEVLALPARMLVLSDHDRGRERSALGLADGSHAVAVAVTADQHRRLLVAETRAALPASTAEALVALASTIALGLRAAATSHLLRQQAHQDPLTRLANRVLLEQRLAAAQARADDAPGSSSVVLLIDLDGFKQVNDRFGHAAGDTVLVTTASRLLASFRPEDLVARLGGDEFVVLMEQVPTAQNIRLQAERLVRALSAPIRLDGTDARVSASVGVARITARTSPQQALAAADAAMYAAKSAGKATYALARGAELIPAARQPAAPDGVPATAAGAEAHRH
jgi:diguanylate cyclase (GGDEF)-like protein